MAHVRTYTRSDGTLVQEHEDKRTKKHELITHDKTPKPYDDTESEHTVKGREKEHGVKVKLLDSRMKQHLDFMKIVLAKQRASQNLISIELPPEETGFGDEVSNHIKARMEAEKKEIGDEKKEKPVKDEKPLAPNGEPSKLNVVQYMQVNTPEFKEWFGGSQVKDENGDPLVVYHGTDADISEFKETPSKTGHPSAKLGYFFTASPRIADRFNRDMKGAGDFSDPAKQPYSKGANIAPVFLSIENMKTLSARDYRDLMGDLDSEPTEEYGWTRTPENWLALKNKWAKEGFDGLCVLADKNANDPGLEEYGADQYIVFNSNQIKSAIGNKGSFKGDDVDITKSFGLPPILTTDAWWSQWS